MNKVPKAFLRIIALVAAVFLAGCSGTTGGGFLPDRKVEYKKVKEAEKNLEIPPDLTRSSISDELVIPDTASGGTATLSRFETREQITGRRRATNGSVLPEISDIEVRRDGDQRWLHIQGEPEEVWFQVLDFWQENGILLVEQDPTVGVMVTDWLENRADIRSDFITDTIRKAFGGLYSAATRDQYRVRIEPGIEPETTELYLTMRGMQETIIQEGQNEVTNTVWNPRETDQGLEAEMLRRLMIYMGVAEQRATQELVKKAAVSSQRSQLVKADDQVSLLVDEGFSRAWRLTGVALDRVGFAVEDRNRSEGTYYVRYNDPMEGVEDQGLLDKLAFWRDSDRGIDKEQQYQVRLLDQVEKTSLVIMDQQGERDNSETALRILTLLHEQLR